VGEPVPPSGAQFEIHHGDQRAVVTEVGATLRAYQRGGRAILDGFDVGAMADGARGAVLAPWPNRLAQSRWTAPDGSMQQLPITEPRTGSALHGLVQWLPWHVAASTDDAVSLEVTRHPRPGYPFTLHLLARYALDGAGLTCTVTATNRGSGDAPYGIGHHPYVACPDGVDTARLRIPASQRLELDDSGIPTGRLIDVRDTPFDFRTPRSVGDLQLDTCYTALDRDGDGRVCIDVDGITVWMDAPFAWLMVYSGDTLAPERRRRGLAIEPMTCPPDAFNNGQGIVVLRPGEQCTTSWGISPRAAAGRALPS
jgi:aldose 1-epimerase